VTSLALESKKADKAYLSSLKGEAGVEFNVSLELAIIVCDGSTTKTSIYDLMKLLLSCI